MLYSQEELDGFVRDPRESLDTELKSWIDPTTDEGIVKIAKAVIALFNNNGGRLIIGISDNGTPDNGPIPPDVREAFHWDVIQAIVTKFASQPIEVTVNFGLRDTQEYPIISVPSGVEIPVVAKSHLTASDGSKITTDTVYVRTLNSSNAVGSAPARAKDWPRLAKICFDNREADIGAFFRRHIGQLENLGFLGTNLRPPDPTPIDQAIAFLDVGQRFFQQAAKDMLPKGFGTRESSIVLAGEIPSHALNAEFLRRLESQKPNHTGWTPWIISEGRPNDPTNAYIIDNGYQRLLFDLEGRIGFTFGDFWRIEQGGKFYHLRVLEDDMPARMGQVKPAPGTQLDFLLQISRTAEILSVGLSFARALGCNEKETSLAFAFRWNGIADRHLTSWVEPTRMFHGRDVSHQTSVVTDALVPLETPQSAIAPYVETLVAPLFALFGGMAFESRVIEGIVRKTLENRF